MANNFFNAAFSKADAISDVWNPRSENVIDQNVLKTVCCYMVVYTC